MADWNSTQYLKFKAQRTQPAVDLAARIDTNPSEIIDIGIELGIIEKSGSWFSYNGEKIAQGREKAVDYFESNPEIYEEVKAAILDAFYNKGKKAD